MPYKLKPYHAVLILALGLLGSGVFSVTFAKFSSSAGNVNNTFKATNTFPTPIPSPTNTPQITPTPIISNNLVINEVLPDSTCSNSGNKGIFIEIWNGTGSSMGLKDYQLTNGSTTIIITSNNSTKIPANSFGILVLNTLIIGNGKCIPDIHGAVQFVLPNSPNIFNPGTLQLKDGSNNIIDVVIWGSGQSLQPTVNQSIERSPTGHDSTTGNNFTSSDFVIRTTPRPGQ